MDSKLHSVEPSADGGRLVKKRRLTVPKETPRASSRDQRPFLSVIIPTKNERDNVRELLNQLESVLPADTEIVFVDDSSDDTPQVIEAEAAERPWPVRVVHRPEAERGDGLAGAVVLGLQSASAEWACIMDADLQHPPTLLSRMVSRAQAGGVDVVVASRYCGTAAEYSDVVAAAMGGVRRFLSRASTRAAQILFPRSLRGVSDPMSGFFLVRRSVIPFDRLRPHGFKILLEILIRSRDLRVAEIPFVFGSRHAGESKASLGEGTYYLWQLVRLRAGGSLARFLSVGLTGLAVNAAAFYVFNGIAHLHYLLAAVLSTQFSTTWNFVLAEKWVFGHRDLNRSLRVRFVSFVALNNASLLLRGPALYLLVTGGGLNPALANFLSLLAITAARFAAADTVIWSSSGSPSRPRLFWYRIHDEISVEAPVRLRELERFRVREPIARPTVRVRFGRLSRQQSSLVSALVSRISHIRYDEGLGPLGFAVDISNGRHVEIVASPLLRFSPHVLYTNVVEPTLRWSFVKRGYVLAHCACIAADGKATLITALTDTGKTTTILKLLDRYPAAFLSDDLTLIRADGEVLTYPKPLTISRHTVAAVKTPLLNRRERLALIVQSRVHSRSGRQFGQLIANLRLPAATINAVVQSVIPPPKYHVERLVPGVEVASRAHLSNLVVIERGGTGRTWLEHGQAVDVLVANSDDAYGFPPYPALASFLHSSNGRDLRAEEERIIASALTGVPCQVIRSETMDWWQRVAAVLGVGDPIAEPRVAADGMIGERDPIAEPRVAASVLFEEPDPVL